MFWMLLLFGWFSIYALEAGATSVDSVDASKKAIELTNRNVEAILAKAPRINRMRKMSCEIFKRNHGHLWCHGAWPARLCQKHVGPSPCGTGIQTTQRRRNQTFETQRNIIYVFLLASRWQRVVLQYHRSRDDWSWTAGTRVASNYPTSRSPRQSFSSRRKLFEGLGTVGGIKKERQDQQDPVVTLNYPTLAERTPPSYYLLLLLIDNHSF